MEPAIVRAGGTLPDVCLGNTRTSEAPQLATYSQDASTAICSGVESVVAAPVSVAFGAALPFALFGQLATNALPEPGALLT